MISQLTSSLALIYVALDFIGYRAKVFIMKKDSDFNSSSSGYVIVKMPMPTCIDYYPYRPREDEEEVDDEEEEEEDDRNRKSELSRPKTETF